MSALSAAVLALALVVPTQEPAPGRIHGVVVSETGERIVAATVTVTAAGGRELSTHTDDRGRYLLRDVPAGERVLRVEAAGYGARTLSVRVPSGADLELDLTLDLRPIMTAPLVVTADPAPSGADSLPDAGVRLAGHATSRAVAAAPALAEIGLAASTAPSHEPVDPTDILYVRGSAADLKRVLLDGAPVYAPFHVAGLLSPFAPATLGAGSLYLGGAPARYDGGLAYVLDLRTRPTSRAGSPRVAGALDLLGVHASVDVALGDHAGAWASARTTHPFGVAAVRRNLLPYAYADLLGRADVDVGENDRIHATVFWNEETVRLDADPGPDGSASWGNTAGAIRYAGDLGGAAAEVTAAFGRFAAHVPTGGPDFIGDAVARQARFAANLWTDPGGLDWRYGLSVERLEMRSGAAANESTDSPPTLDAVGIVGGVHIEAAWQPRPDLRLRAGTRLDAYSGVDGPRLGPRLALTWVPTDAIAVTLAGGRYHQLLPALLVGPDDEIAGHTLGLAGATHVVARLRQTPLEGVDLGVEGYHKRFDGVPGSASWTDAYASGVDLWVRVARDRWTGSAGYSLEWTWAQAGDVAAASFAGRHLLSAGVEGPIGEAGRFDLRLGYGAGLPYTAIAGSTTADAPEVATFGSLEGTDVARLEADAVGAPWVAPLSEPFLRIDVEASRDWTVSWSGDETVLTPYVKVLNAFGDRDGVFFRRTVDSGDPEPVDAAPILPIIGIRWRF